jgi:hypothetical protein
MSQHNREKRNGRRRMIRGRMSGWIPTVYVRARVVNRVNPNAPVAVATLNHWYCVTA